MTEVSASKTGFNFYIKAASDRQLFNDGDRVSSLWGEQPFEGEVVGFYRDKTGALAYVVQADDGRIINVGERDIEPSFKIPEGYFHRGWLIYTGPHMRPEFVTLLTEVTDDMLRKYVYVRKYQPVFVPKD